MLTFLNFLNFSAFHFSRVTSVVCNSLVIAVRVLVHLQIHNDHKVPSDLWEIKLPRICLWLLFALQIRFHYPQLIEPVVRIIFAVLPTFLQSNGSHPCRPHTCHHQWFLDFAVAWYDRGAFDFVLVWVAGIDCIEQLESWSERNKPRYFPLLTQVCPQGHHRLS
jgi:hypothetical protein